MSPVLDNRVHTLYGHIGVVVGGEDYTDEYEGLSYDNVSPGGYGTCNFMVRHNPPDYGEAILITYDGSEVWTGTVANTPGVVNLGENEPVYEVIGEGPSKAEAAAQSSNFAMAFVDRDYGRWFQIDCKNWGGSYSAMKLDSDSNGHLRIGASDFSGLLYASDNWLIGDRIFGAEWDPKGEPGDPEYVPGTPRHLVESTATNDPTDFPYDEDIIYPVAPILWSAFYYVPNEGVTADKITAFTCKAAHNLNTPIMDARKIIDFEHPQETYNEDEELLPKYCWTKPSVAMWTEFYGLEGTPPCLFAGIYACDDPTELPVRSAKAMFNHPLCVHTFDPKDPKTADAIYLTFDPKETAFPPEGADTFEIDPEDGLGYWIDVNGDRMFSAEAENVDLTIPIDSKNMLVFYMAYRPIRVPVSHGLTDYDEDTGIWKRTNWAAINQVFLESGMYVQLSNCSVYCNGFFSNNVADALNRITPGDYPSFVVDDKTSIMVPPFTTRSAAIESLLGLYPRKVVWEYENAQALRVAEGSYGTITLNANEPGVSVKATIKKDSSGNTSGGTVGSMTVVYNDNNGPEDNRTIHAWTSKYITIDADGNPATPETISGYLDLSGTAHSGESAIGAAVSYIEEAGGGTIGTDGSSSGMQWEGTITLRAIYGAAALKSGYKVNCGPVEGALITAVNVDVDSETATLSLGGTGYQGRFNAVSGLGPNSATPFQHQQVEPFQIRNAARRS
jgi:hypothetical protein